MIILKITMMIVKSYNNLNIFNLNISKNIFCVCSVLILLFTMESEKD